MKYLGETVLIGALFISVQGCAKKEMPQPQSQQHPQQTVRDINTSIKKTNIIINSYTTYPAFTTSDYTSIPSE